MSFDDLITPALIYLSIGGVIWLVLDGLGIVDNTFSTRRRLAKVEMVLATLMAIFAWPRILYRWLKGMWGRV